MKRVLITGCGRSGTLYMARLLKALGIQVEHEAIGADGAVGWQYAAAERWTGYNRGCGDERGGRLDYTWGCILHQVRHPLKTISATTWGQAPQWAFIDRQLGGRLPAGDDIMHKAMAYWLYWNQLAASVATWTYRIEDIVDGSPTLAKWCQYLDIPVPAQLPNIPRDTNSRPHAHLTWADLAERDAMLTEAIREYARGLGCGYNE